MRSILVLGSGAREHVIVNKLSESREISNIYVSPGNVGMKSRNNVIIECISLNDFDTILNFIELNNIKTVIVGPEQYLVDGITDFLNKHNIDCFGPTKYASQIEGSKQFSKEFMFKNTIPTSDFEYFDDYDHCFNYIESLQKEYTNRVTKNKQLSICDCVNNPKCKCEFNKVIKASGLAGGKGVVLLKSFYEAFKAIDYFFL